MQFLIGAKFKSRCGDKRRELIEWPGKGGLNEDLWSLMTNRLAPLNNARLIVDTWKLEEIDC